MLFNCDLIVTQISTAGNCRSDTHDCKQIDAHTKAFTTFTAL